MLFDLVFEGGGMRGVAFVGALEALADSGHEFGRVMGSSVGGLAAALLSTGHDARTLRDLIFDPQTGYLAFADAMSASYPPFTRQAIEESATRRLLSDVDFSFFPDLIEDSLDTMVAHGTIGKQKLHPLFSFIEHMSISEDSQWLAWLLLNTLLANSGGPTADVVGSRVLRLPVSGIDVYGFEVHRDQLLPAINKAYNVTQEFLSGWQDDPRAHLTQFEQQYVQIVAEQFIVSGDYYKIGDIIGSKGVAIGEAASVDIQQSGDMP